MRNLLAAAATVASILVVTLVGAGCAPATTKTTKLSSVGDKGELTFKFDSCLLDCALDQPALQGSAVSITAKGGKPNVALSVRLADSAVATISEQSYVCDGTDCRLQMKIETKQQGEEKLEVVDKAGNVVDSVALHVKAASAIEVHVAGHELGPDNYFTVKQGEKLAVESTVFDDDRSELVFSQHGVSQEYGDKSVVGPDEDLDLFGSSDTEKAVAKNVGDATLTLRAPGAETIVRFHVTK
jgi:hypothetical protein